MDRNPTELQVQPRSADPKPRGLPRRTFLLAVAAVSAGLVISALHSFWTLNDLRRDFLMNRGRDVAALLDRQVRGPGRRSNLEAWRSTAEDTLKLYPDSVAWLSITDGTGKTLVSVPNGFDPQPALFVFEGPLTMSRGPRWDETNLSMGVIRVGLYTAEADFIARQAWVHLFVSGTAVVLLIVLSLNLLRTLEKYLFLKVQEESERHLARIGRMSATLAHEIRNPLGAMKGLTQLVQEDLPRTHQSQALMDTVVSEAERLEKLVTDLLAYAKPKAIRLEMTDLEALVSAVVELLSPQAEQSGLRFRMSVSLPQPASIRTDRDGLRQLLINVLVNAIEASPENTEIEIQLARKAGQISIEILDRGAGLGEEDPGELFQPFKTTKTKGSGLGLAVSKRIIQDLGGSISLSNRTGGGAVCSITLPAS